jgi:Flp pilus assembly protein TadD
MTGLGIEMAAAGLPKSAERFLVKQPAGFARNATLADIAAARGGETNLGQARDYYQSALTFKPDSAELRGKLASVLDRLGDTTAAAVQRQLVSKIEAGKP